MSKKKNAVADEFETTQTEVDLFSVSDDSVEPVDEAEDTDDEDDDSEEEESEKKPKKKGVDLFKKAEEDDDDEEEEEYDEEDEDDSADDDVEEEDDEDEDEEEKPKKKRKGGFKSKSRTTLDFLINEGYIELTDDYDPDELDEDDIEEVISDGFEKAVQGSIAETFAAMPDIVRRFNKFVIDGGDPLQFIATAATQMTSGHGGGPIDLNREEDQIRVVASYFQTQDMDAEEINEQIEFLKDSGRLKKTAEKHMMKFQQRQAMEQQRLQQQQEIAATQYRQQIKAQKQALTHNLRRADIVGELPISLRDKKELPSYLLDRSVKLTNGSYITELQRDIHYDVLQNEEATIQLAILMRNRNEDGTFNFDAIAREASTKETKRIRQGLSRSKPLGGRQSKVAKVSKKKSLADYFD